MFSLVIILENCCSCKELGLFLQLILFFSQGQVVFDIHFIINFLDVWEWHFPHEIYVWEDFSHAKFACGKTYSHAIYAQLRVLINYTKIFVLFPSID